MIRVAELEGEALNHWVAIAMGIRNPEPGTVTHDDPIAGWVLAGRLIEELAMSLTSPHSPVHRQGGPLAGWGEAGHWGATTWRAGADGRRAFGHHPTDARVAICRCYVMHKLGREVTE